MNSPEAMKLPQVDLTQDMHIPTLQELDFRFTDLTMYLEVRITLRGYIAELKSYGPFRGMVSLRKIINLLDKNVNVEPIEDDDVIKLMHSIIWYNEYVCVNDSRYHPAYTAWERIESLYSRRFGKERVSADERNPFICTYYREKFNTDVTAEESTGVELSDIDRYVLDRKTAKETNRRSNQGAGTGVDQLDPPLMINQVSASMDTGSCDFEYNGDPQFAEIEYLYR